jgi:hypothetical protein
LFAVLEVRGGRCSNFIASVRITVFKPSLTA